jgi:hypothetical protein
VILFLPVAWQAFTLAKILLARFSCPLDIEYLESPHVYHAWRLAHHLPLYADPASGFATFPYPPLYWVALRGAAVLFGFTVQAGRAVSIASLLLAATVLAVQVVRAAPSRGLGIGFAAFALGGICAGFRMSDGAYDWTRSDTLAAFLAILAAAVARDGRMPWRRALTTALILSLSIYTKQSGVFFAAWIIGFACWQDRTGGLRLAAATAVLCAVPLAVLDVATHGWFLLWLLYPSHQPLHPWWVGASALGSFVLHAPFLLAMPWVVATLRKRRGLKPATALWTGMLAVAVVSGALTSLKQFTCGNVWISELLLAWPVGAMLAGDWLSGSWPGEPARVTAWRAMSLAAALLLALAYDPSRFMPAADRWEAARRLDDIARGLDGGVVVTTAPMVGVGAGGPSQQPILAAYEDARSAGMSMDYVAALVATGARWVVTTDRYAGTDQAPEPRMSPYFTRERTYDFNLHSLSTWDRPTNVVLWRRAYR